MPGKDNCFSDATSRNPVERPDESIDQYPDSTFLHSLHISDERQDTMETELAAVAASDFRAVTWELVRRESSHDQQIQSLISYMTAGMPTTSNGLPVELQQFWQLRNDLYVIDGVVLFKQRVLVPKTLRSEILQSLHSAHQGMTAMNERAKTEVYWPGITVTFRLYVMAAMIVTEQLPHRLVFLQLRR